MGIGNVHLSGFAGQRIEPDDRIAIDGRIRSLRSGRMAATCKRGRREERGKKERKEGNGFHTNGLKNVEYKSDTDAALKVTSAINLVQAK